MKISCNLASVLLMLVPATWAATPPNRPLGLQERVDCQRAIEQVYHTHRIWPKENPQPKRPLEHFLSEEDLWNRAEDLQRKTAALAHLWGRTPSANHLQGEMERMARRTRDPRLLQALWSALGNDPHVIAECLARPLLTDRWIHAFYAADREIHAATRRQAEEALNRAFNIDLLRNAAPKYSLVEWRRGEGPDEPPAGTAVRRVPDETQWDRTMKRLLEELGLPPGSEASIVRGIISPLREDETRFYALAVLDRGSDAVTVATAEWPKEPFDGWWARHKDGFSPAVFEESGTDYSLPSIRMSACADQTWVPMTTTGAPDARKLHSTVWTGTEMIVWGGTPDESITFLNTGGRYNPATDAWTATSTNGVPSERNQHTAVWTGTTMIVWGGQNAGGKLNSGGRYDPVADTWTATNSTGAPSERYVHTAVWTGTVMVIWGGYGTAYLNDGGRYDPAGDTWNTVNPANAASARYFHTAVWTGTEMIVWGGYNGSVMGGGKRYNPSTDTWVADLPSSNAPSARYQHRAVWTGSAMIVWGGNTGTTVNTGSRYDPVSNTWSVMTATGAPADRHLHGAVWDGAELIVWGGKSIPGGALNSGGRYNPSLDRWTTATETTGAPGARAWHSAVWTGSEMVVWGGSDGSTFYNTGGRYTHGMDSWTPTTLTGAPTARSGHTAAWTGVEMIVWGDYSIGGRYYPSTDSWASTASSGAPTDRDRHTAVWTGSDMIIWGGFDYTNYLNTGGRYNPVSNAWTATTTSGAPGGRMLHGAVWDGTRMTVWGGCNTGYGCDNVFNTGGRYNPAGDTWTATSPTGAPAGRKYHTTVWTGSEMIVWGGSNGAAELNTGGRYAPATDLWSSMTSTNAPSERIWHSAVWTGGEMIVWGGYKSLEFPRSDGKRYRPSSNTWSAPISSTNAPTARYQHAAVWTGTEMIVWGGYTYVGGEQDFNTGGRFDPASDHWTPTSTVRAPSGRRLHSAVWTGTDMIVWGGYDEASDLRTGGLYCSVPCSAPDFGGIASATDTDDCQTGIQIAWQPPVSWGLGATSGTYEVRRYAAAGCRDGYAALATGLPPATTTFSDTGTTPGETYYYQVVAANDCNPNLFSLGDVFCSGPVSDNTPLLPSNNNAADVSGCEDTGVLITWTADPLQWGDRLLLSENWEGDISAWTTSQLWHVTDASGQDCLAEPYPSPSKTAYYGRDSACDYDVGNVYGDLQSAAIPDIKAGTKLRFRYLREVESSATTNDRTIVFASPDGAGWTQVWYLDASTPSDPVWTDSGPISLATWAGQSVQLRFRFNSLSGTGNTFTGWAVDDVQVGSGGRSYDVLRDGIAIATGIPYGVTSFLDTAGTNEQTYAYSVRYNNGCGGSVTTAGKNALDHLASVPVTGNNGASDLSGCLDTGLRIYWTAPSSWGDGGTGSRSIQVLRNGEAIATLAGSATYYTDLTGINGQTYAYQVRFTNGCGLTHTTAGNPGMDHVGHPPLPLPNSSASDNHVCIDSGVRITWASDPLDWGDENSSPWSRACDVVRDGGTIAADLSYGTTAYEDATGVNGQPYLYQVRYKNGCALGDLTIGNAAADGVDTGPCPEVGPTLRLTKSGSNAHLDWSGVGCGDLLYYRVYAADRYDLPFPASWQSLGYVLTPGKDDPLASANGAYRIVTVDNCGNASP